MGHTRPAYSGISLSCAPPVGPSWPSRLVLDGVAGSTRLLPRAQLNPLAGAPFARVPIARMSVPSSSVQWLMTRNTGCVERRGKGCNVVSIAVRHEIPPNLHKDFINEW